MFASSSAVLNWRAAHGCTPKTVIWLAALQESISIRGSRGQRGTPYSRPARAGRRKREKPARSPIADCAGVPLYIVHCVLRADPRGDRRGAAEKGMRVYGEATDPVPGTLDESEIYFNRIGIHAARRLSCRRPFRVQGTFQDMPFGRACSRDRCRWLRRDPRAFSDRGKNARARTFSAHPQRGRNGLEEASGSSVEPKGVDDGAG